MEWNVYYHNINHQTITALNVFQHGGFRGAVRKVLDKYNNKDEASEEIRREAFYYFCSKSEYEIIISACVGGNGNETEKIDIYSQLLMNWDRFVDYVWEFK